MAETSSSKKKTWNVVNAQGTKSTVTGTRAERPDSVTVEIYDGDDFVAGFRGYQDFSPAE